MKDEELDEEFDFSLGPGYVPASKKFIGESPLTWAEEVQAKLDAVRLKYTLARKTIEVERRQVGAGSDLEREAEQRARLRCSQFLPYFAQLPDALLRTKRVTPEAKVVFALMHMHAPIKGLNLNPVVEISQESLADEMGRTEVTIRTLIKQLVDEGWVGKYRQGRMKVNRYVLYPRSKRTWEAHIAMERVQLRISRDQGLAMRLRKSLYPITDQKNSYGHSNPAKTRVTKRVLRAY